MGSQSHDRSFVLRAAAIIACEQTARRVTSVISKHLPRCTMGSQSRARFSALWWVAFAAVNFFKRSQLKVAWQSHLYAGQVRYDGAGQVRYDGAGQVRYDGAGQAAWQSSLLPAQVGTRAKGQTLKVALQSHLLQPPPQLEVATTPHQRAASTATSLSRTSKPAAVSGPTHKH